MVKFFQLVGQLDIPRVNSSNKIHNLFDYLFKIIADYEDFLTTHDGFAHQPSTASVIVDNNDDKSIITAPCVPMVLGTKRERLPDETVIRRSKMNKYLN